MGCIRVIVLLSLAAAPFGRAADLPAEPATPPNDQSKAEFDRLVAALRRSSSPVRPADLARPPAKADENAVPHLQSALTLTKPDAPEWKDINALSWRGPIDEKTRPKIKAILVEKEQVERQVETALALKHVDWQIKPAVPMVNTALPQLRQLRGLSNYLRVASWQDEQSGNLRAVVRRLVEMKFLGSAAEEMPGVIAYLVATGLDAQCVYAIENRLPNLKMDLAHAAEVNAGVRQLISELLDEDHHRAVLFRALDAERVQQVEAIELLATGKIKFKDLTGRANEKDELVVAITDLWQSGVILLKYSAEVRKAADAPNWPACQPMVPKKPGDRVHFTPEAGVAGVLSVSMDRVLIQHYIGVAHRRLAATALAIYLYAADHSGQLPDRLDDLAPQYLKAVPDDPMGASGTLRYIRDGTHPRLYSVGRNGIDDGGRSEFDTPEAERETKSDIVFELPSGWK